MGNCDIFGVDDWCRGLNHLREQETIYTAFFFSPKGAWGESALGFLRLYSIHEYSPDYIIGVCLQLRGAVCEQQHSRSRESHGDNSLH